MKKTTIYTLLCTTILASGISLATDKTETPVGNRVAKLKEGSGDKSTPVKLREQALGIPQTPPPHTLLHKFPLSEYSPTGQQYEAEREARRIHLEKEMERRKLKMEADRIEHERKLQSIREEEEAKGKKRIEERRLELEREAEEASKRLEAEMIEQLQNERERSEEALAKITSQIENLKIEAAKAREEAETQVQSSSKEVDRLQKAVKRTREDAKADAELLESTIKTLEEEAAKERQTKNVVEEELEQLRVKNKKIEELLALKTPKISVKPQHTVLSSPSLESAATSLTSNGASHNTSGLPSSVITSPSLSSGNGVSALNTQPQPSTIASSVTPNVTEPLFVSNNFDAESDSSDDGSH